MKAIDIIIFLGIIGTINLIDIDKEVIKGIVTGIFIGAYYTWRYKS